MARPLKASRTRPGQGSSASSARNPVAAASATSAASVKPNVRSRLCAIVPLFPFEFGKGRGGVSGIILRERLPEGFFRLAGCLGGGRDIGTAGYQVAHVLRQALEVAALLIERPVPVFHDRTMAGYDTGGRQTGEIVAYGKPAADAPVDDRDVPGEEEVAREQGSGRLVEHRQVVVGVGGRPGLKHERPMAEVEGEFAGHQGRGRDDPYLRQQFVAHRAAERVDVMLPAGGECPRQIPVANENRAFARKGRIAEHVIRMHVGIDHVADRLGRNLAEGGREPAPFLDAAAGVDPGACLVPDDEADVGDVASVLPRHQRDVAHMYEYAGGGFLNLERRWLRVDPSGTAECDTHNGGSR